MKREIVIIGFLLIVIGGIEFLIEYYQVSSLMNVTGIALLMFGFFLFLVGVISSEITKDDYAIKSSTPKQESQQSSPKQAAVRTCPRCGRQVIPDAHLCPFCGYDLLECR